MNVLKNIVIDNIKIPSLNNKDMIPTKPIILKPVFTCNGICKFCPTLLKEKCYKF